MTDHEVDVDCSEAIIARLNSEEWRQISVMLNEILDEKQGGAATAA